MNSERLVTIESGGKSADATSTNPKDASLTHPSNIQIISSPKKDPDEEQTKKRKIIISHIEDTEQLS